METARRVKGLTSAVFSEIDNLKHKLQEKGMDVIDLSIGSPDLPPAPHIVKALVEAMSEPGAFSYALTEGLPEFKQTVADWYRMRFGVSLDPEREVLSLMGSQDGLAHINLAFVNPGDVVLVPDPGYPIYRTGVKLAEGEVYPLPLLEENDFLPDFEAIPDEVAKKAKMMILNYPNNPVAATADLDFFEQAVEFARANEIILCHDVAYSELAYDGYRPPSILQVKGAKDICVEFHSLSKTYNMAGCRLGFVCGCAKVLDGLRVVKSNIDYGVFKAVQKAGIAALRGPQDYVRATANLYQRRRDILVDGLREAGWMMEKPRASMFVWAPVPTGFGSSRQFVWELAERTGVLVVPGDAFGERGEGYVRIGLVADEERLEEAVKRIHQNFGF
ncbi:MAG: LL-diaminopimelate aminotransferase [Peptococcaceae bacterium]|nr:LL-diaminopimelate aminotransferase [Peptococcaceae bacterium]